MNKVSLLTLISLLLWATMPSARGVSLSNTEQAVQTTAGYWTPEHLRSARPVPFPRAEEVVPSSTPTRTARQPMETVSRPGRGPTEKIEPGSKTLFAPDASSSRVEPESAAYAEPSSYGTEGAYFSSSRVFPAPAAQNRYPYAAAGKLFFTGADGLNYVCSAAVIRPRLVVTAGHCVYDAVRQQWNSNWLFVPAYHKGSQPYEQWTWTWVITTEAWANGGGFVPNAGDFAVIEMADNDGKRIGNVTGYYGYTTNALYPNHVRMLGYPVAFDDGQWMHEVDAQSFRMTIANCVDYGSDMTGGSSGGPWIQNFGVLAAGQSVSPLNRMNRLVGITSYGPLDTARRYQGASILDATFANSAKTGILDLACAHKAGNCP